MRVNVWIRKENEAAWSALENKSEWLNDHLNTHGTLQTLPPITSKRVKLDKPMAFTDDTVVTANPLKETITIDNGIEKQTVSTKPGMFDRNPEQCKHGNIIGTCVKGCK